MYQTMNDDFENGGDIDGCCCCMISNHDKRVKQ